MNMTTPGLESEIERLVGEHMAATRLAITSAVERAFSRMTVGAATTARAAGRRAAGRRAAGPTRTAGPRRAAEEIGALAERLYEAVSANPGASMSMLSSELGASPRELNRPAALLRKADRVRTVGQRQATRYFPMVTKAGPKP